MAGNAPQTPTSSNVGQVPAAQQQQPQSSTEELRAFDWFEPFVRDYQEHEEDNQAPKTDEIFASYDAFKKRLEDTFSDIDKERNAERQL
ncbi:hypothetical protein CNMCM6805_005980 [Aspergillus fumigatiaffinis]|uniref:Uncharacterized protein n=1 Tax=Aspergillus fumigatiaffinis TaxID=340414 RepID=A0A8H4M1R2_9EURO|nr:hypothetical protein CNMCM6805_005980 [Aspergillus fumigatiaffinis]